MKMISRKVVLPVLLLSLVVGLGVSADAAQTNTPKKKTAASGAHSRRVGKKGSKTSGRQRGQKAPTNDRISEIQNARHSEWKMGRLDRGGCKKVSGGARIKSYGTIGCADVAKIRIGFDHCGRGGTANATWRSFTIEFF